MQMGEWNMSLADSSRPRILIIAGPNGSGKSTITKNIPICGTYVNADEIQRISLCTDLEAAQEAEQIRKLLLKANKDFTFETVLSTERNLELLRHAKKQGYEVQSVFVLTNDPCINVKRVKARVRAGGHDVPEEKIINRYEKSLNNLAQLVRIADRTFVIDNSTDKPHLICEVSNKHVTIWETELWSKKAILRLLADKQK
jgi:predicted ABC-type ATPase